MSSIEKAIEKLGRAKANDDRISRELPREDVIQPSASIQNDAHSTTDGNSSSNYEEIDLAKLRSLGILTPDTTNSLIAEEFRHIKRPLLKNAFGFPVTMVDQGNLIVVTSAIPEEGKTFTSINLAMSIAMERDRSVLLVDADVTKSGVTKRLGLSPGLGLTDYLMSESLQLSDVLIYTNIPKLTILKSGQDNHSMAELFASENMKLLTNDLAHRYPDRIVIFDSPPLMAASEAGVLASLVGQIVFVIEAGKTQRSVVQEALNLLDKSKAIGFVLNKTSKSIKSRYSYGYGYGARS